MLSPNLVVALTICPELVRLPTLYQRAASASQKPVLRQQFVLIVRRTPQASNFVRVFKISNQGEKEGQISRTIHQTMASLG